LRDSYKKSRFLGSLYPVESLEEAAEKLGQIKKKFWDATHNCSAMILGEDSSIMRFSDDGEPQGTAGVPMLEVLKQRSVTNVLAVVTRYFGEYCWARADWSGRMRAQYPKYCGHRRSFKGFRVLFIC